MGGNPVDALKLSLQVGAIWVISERHERNKVAVASAGGISPTVQILAGGVQQHATFTR